MPRLSRLILAICAVAVAALPPPQARAQAQSGNNALPPKTARLCINGNACANLTWTGSRYEARGDNQTNVSSIYKVLAWSKDRVELQGTTTAPVDGVNLATGDFRGTIAAGGDHLDNAVYDWKVGAKSGTAPFTFTWGDSPAAPIAPRAAQQQPSAGSDDAYRKLETHPLENSLPPNIASGEAYPPPPSPAWQPAAPAPGPDINGTWEADLDGKPLKIRIVHVRNRIWAYNVSNVAYLAPNQEAFQGEYSVGPKAKIQAQGFVNGKVTWGWTFLTVTSDSAITIGGADFHKITGPAAPVKDMPCNPRNLPQMDGREAYGRGQIYYALEEVPTADCWYYVAATKGDPDGQASYGYALRFGRGITQDRAQAFHWFQLAAMQSNYYGMYNLAAMIDEGYAGPRSTERLIYWGKRMRANQPTLPLDGVHVTVSDDVKWVYFTSPPCSANSSGVSGDQALNNGIVAFQAYAFERAACWFTIADKQGNKHADVYLALLNVYGWGVPANQKAGFDLMSRAADANDWFARAYLAEFYRRGIGTPADYATARAIYLKVSDIHSGGYRAWAIVSGTQLNEIQASQLRNGFLLALMENHCSGDEVSNARASYGDRWSWHVNCDPNPDTKASEDAAMDEVTHDVRVKNTLDYPEEISPEYVPPGNPFTFNVWK
jgi:TPR repeat protein